MSEGPKCEIRSEPGVLSVGTEGAMTIAYRLVPTRHRSVTRGSKPKPAPKRPRLNDRLARMLALAHHIDRLILDGKLVDYADAAARLGLSRARVTQVMNFLHLAPDLQEAILLREAPVRERCIRLAVQHSSWEAQGLVVAGTGGREPGVLDTRRSG